MDDAAQKNASQEAPKVLRDSQTPQTAKKLNWKGFGIGIIIVIIIEIIAFNALKSSNQQKPIASPDSKPTISQPVNNVTASWKIFTDNESYSIKYPPTWVPSTATIEAITTNSNEKSSVIIYNGKLDSNIPNSEHPYPSTYVAISTMDSAETPQQFIQDNPILKINANDKKALADIEKSMNIRSYTVNRLPGLIYNEPGQGGRGLIIVLSNGKKLFLLNFSAKSQDDSKIIDQILSTFKFTN